MQRAAKEAATQPLRPGVYVHVVQHCVANRPPNPGRYRMLFETAPGRRRLFRNGDVYQTARARCQDHPNAETFRRNTQVCSNGIETGIKTVWKTESRTILSWRYAGPARNCGPKSMPTNTCADFAKAGNESHLLGYKPFHLSVGGLRNAVADRRRPSHQNAASGRSTRYIDSYIG